jgi:choline dehydrogenase-like flavoprotein
MRDGAFRTETAAFRVPIGNDGWSFGGENPIQRSQRFLGEGTRGQALPDAVGTDAARHVRLAALIEELPSPDNRVTLADERDALGLPRPKLTYAIDDYVKRGRDEAIKLADLVFDGLGATERTHVESLFGAGHIMGTYRMGTDPATSVVEPTGRSHDHANLFLVGSGVFPSGGTANPTLTLAALALMAEAEIEEQLTGG